MPGAARRRVLFNLPIVLFAVFVTTLSAQQSSVVGPPATLTIGKSVIRLGATKDSIIPTLALQYSVKAMFPNCTADLPPCRTYEIYETDNYSIGSLEFDQQGKLVKAWVELLPGAEYHAEGMIGNMLVGVIAGLLSEGQKCSLAGSSSESVDLKDPGRLIPEVMERQGIIECGSKRVRIISLVRNGKPDSMQIRQEIGCSAEVVGGCQR